MDNKEIQRLFERFSGPLRRPCVSTAQKEKAIGISKLLWLTLITETDSEHSIYEILARILNYDHDAIIALGSLYFFKMKPTLKQQALSKLKKHYKVPHHLMALRDWYETIDIRHRH